MVRPTPCDITPHQEKLWTETRTTLLWTCPAFSHIFYTLLDTTNSKHVALFTRDVPIAATDGSCIMLNPDTFFKYKLQERVFAVAHEILHCILHHCEDLHRHARDKKVRYPDGKEHPYNADIMNVALDLVINDCLIESDVGQFNTDWMHDTKIATHRDSGIDIYRKLFKDQSGGGSGQPGGGSGQAPKGQRFDEHLSPGTSQGKDPNQAIQDRDDIRWQTEVAAAASAARVQGKLPAGLERILQEVLEPKVDWREHIQALFARKVGTGSFTWRQHDRRLIVRDIIAPGRSGFGADTVVVGADTSGSIGDDELDMFMAEIAGILEDVRPRQILLVWCDAKVHRVDEADEPSDLNTIRAKKAPGGGGTSFIPVFEWIAENGIEPDALVYLTDGLGSFPDREPSYPVIWGSIYPDAKYPFGDVVEIPKTA